MSFKAEVIADNSGEWVHNAVVLTTEQEAKDYAKDLASRWYLVREWRIVPTDDPPKYMFKNGSGAFIDARSKTTDE